MYRTGRRYAGEQIAKINCPVAHDSAPLRADCASSNENLTARPPATQMSCVRHGEMYTCGCVTSRSCWSGMIPTGWLPLPRRRSLECRLLSLAAPGDRTTVTTDLFSNLTLRADIATGHISRDQFAASLHDVVQGSGPEVYRDPARFFSSSHPSSGMRHLLNAALGRLSGANSTANTLSSRSTTPPIAAWTLHFSRTSSIPRTF
jgi:hypothetical protein